MKNMESARLKRMIDQLVYPEELEMEIDEIEGF